MDMKRREFVRRTLIVGGSVVLWPGCARAEKQPDSFLPAYAKLEEEGRFAERVEQAYAMFRECELCPRQCGVDRKAGETGFCRGSRHPVVFSAHPHLGEELPLVGTKGSGTIFFSNCNLRCVFCQNWPIAHEGRGDVVDDEDVAEMMLRLQRIGCHNINLVTPTHVMPNILRATRIALGKGLRLPLVYNTSGYERPEIVRLLDGIVDIYLPDMKYTDPDQAARYSSGAADYPELARKSIIEMNRQVGGLVTDQRGVALRGLMIRHLVMPNRVAGTRAFVEWVAKALPKTTYVNIMAQYRVEYEAFKYPEIARAIKVDEFLEAMQWAEESGLENLDERSVANRNVYRRRRWLN